MYDWNLYILFGVGGGLFLFFSACFCYYKRQDIIRRREEKIYEDERDGIYAGDQVRIRPMAHSRSSSSNQNGATENPPLAPAADEASSSEIEMQPSSSTGSVSNSSDISKDSAPYHGHPHVNPAFESTEF